MSIHSPPAAVHGSRPEEVIDHRLTEREWAEEWKHLNNVSVQAGDTGATATCGAAGAGLTWAPLCSVPTLGGMGRGLREAPSQPAFHFWSAPQSLPFSAPAESLPGEGHLAWGWDPFNTISRVILTPAPFLGGSPDRRCLQGGDGRVCSVGQTVPRGLKGCP